MLPRTRTNDGASRWMQDSHGRWSQRAGSSSPHPILNIFSIDFGLTPQHEQHQTVARLPGVCTSYGPPTLQHQHHHATIEPRLGRCGENLPTLHCRICAVYGCCSWGCPCWCVCRWWAAAEAKRRVVPRTLSTFRTKYGSHVIQSDPSYPKYLIRDMFRP